MLDTVRTRMTLWYIGVLALALIVFSIGIYALMARKLSGRLDIGLQTAMEGTARLFAHEKEEGETDQYAAGSALRKYYYPRQAVAVFDQVGGLLKEITFGDIHATAPTKDIVPISCGFQESAKRRRAATSCVVNLFGS